jgi:dTDP-4-amino-4,6-dideoxygalactose transaminase
MHKYVGARVPFARQTGSMNPHAITREFEQALCEYTGAPYAVAVTSCTMALLLAVAWHLRAQARTIDRNQNEVGDVVETITRPPVEIPKRTYVGVPAAIIHAGGRPVFRDEDWIGSYQLKPLPVWDCARWFTSGMYSGETHQGVKRVNQGTMACVSFHASKILGDTQGGAILHDNVEADAWLRRARFDGRAEGVHPTDDTFTFAGWHCYMSPDVAARLLWKLSVLPRKNEPLPNDDYPDLSQHEAFR